MRKRILFLCYDPAVLNERMAVLIDAGYRVTGTTKDSEAFDLLTHQKYDLVIVGDQMSNGKRAELDKKSKKLRPATPVLVFLNHPNDPNGVADAVLTSPENPQALLDAVMGLVGRHSDSRSRAS
jgi:DNA-binding response OmpR family regulator